MNEDILLEKIKYLSSMTHSSLVEQCIYLEQENVNYKVQKYITDYISENGIICEKNKQIDQLTNNWNELEEWIMQDVKDEKPDLYFQVLRKIDILDKMKEIKEGNK